MHTLCFRNLFFYLLFACLASSPAFAEPHPQAQYVAIVANSANSDSLRIARYYAQARGIPETNIFTIDVEDSFVIDRATFVEKIREPLLRQLADSSLVEILPGEKDAFSRSRNTIFKNNMRYMVLCHGVPLHISETPETDDAALREKWFGAQTGPNIQFDTGPLAKNESSVDSELTLLLKNETPLNGFIPNPLFRSLTEPANHDVIRVTRLDGPSFRAIRDLIEYALQAEKEGLRGRAYVDIDNRTGGFAEGNEWLERCSALFTQLGFDITTDRDRAIFPVHARMDQPALYAGWYSQNVAGPFTLPGFRFPPGAIAVHIHSFSAQNIHTTNRNWLGPLVDRGITATVGSTAEPYLSLTHHLDAFFLALANGANFAEAAYFSLPSLSWQGVAIGDPLYRPFKVDPDTQLKAIGNPQSWALDPYVIMRKMNLLIAADDVPAALRTGRRQLSTNPNTALALKVAEMLVSQKAENPTRVLDFVPLLKKPASQEWGVLAQVADLLLAHERAEDAWIIYNNILSQKLPKALEIHFLKAAIRTADAAGKNQISFTWSQRLTELDPPKAP